MDFYDSINGFLHRGIAVRLNRFPGSGFKDYSPNGQQGEGPLECPGGEHECAGLRMADVTAARSQHSNERR
jgi:hypothetical protein